MNEQGTAVSSLYIEDLLLAANGDGLIIAYDKNTGRPISDIFSP